MCVWRVGVITGGGGDVCVEGRGVHCWWWGCVWRVGVITGGGGDVCVEGRGDHWWWWRCVCGG